MNSSPITFCSAYVQVESVNLVIIDMNSFFLRETVWYLAVLEQKFTQFW